MILTGGFDGFDVLTAGFDGFDVLTAGFDVFDDFDSWFWWFWCFDSRFWWFWQEVFVFEGCIINDRRFCLLKMLLSGNSPPTHSVYKWVSVFYINQKEKTWATWAWTVYRPLNPQRRGWAAGRRTVWWPVWLWHRENLSVTSVWQTFSMNFRNGLKVNLWWAVTVYSGTNFINQLELLYSTPPTTQASFSPGKTRVLYFLKKTGHYFTNLSGRIWTAAAKSLCTFQSGTG